MSLVLVRSSGNGLWGQWEEIAGPVTQSFVVEDVEAVVGPPLVLDPLVNTTFSVVNPGAAAVCEVKEPKFVGQQVQIYCEGNTIVNTTEFQFADPITSTGNLKWTADAPEQYISLIAFNAFNGMTNETVWRLTSFSGGVLS